MSDSERGTVVFVLDDSRLFLAQIEKLLTEAGFRVFPFSSAMEAMAKIRSSPPDLLLLDVHMPFLDGGKIVEQLRKNPRTEELAIVFCSAMDKNELCILAAEAGATDYLHKETDMPMLPLRLRQILAKARVARATRGSDPS